MTLPDNVISSTSSSDGSITWTREGGVFFWGGGSTCRGVIGESGWYGEKSGWYYSNGCHIQPLLLLRRTHWTYPLYYPGDHITDTVSDADQRVGDVNNSSGSDDESLPCLLVEGNRHGSGDQVDWQQQRQLWLPDQVSPSRIRQVSTYRYHFVGTSRICTKATTGTTSSTSTTGTVPGAGAGVLFP